MNKIMPRTFCFKGCMQGNKTVFGSYSSDTADNAEEIFKLRNPGVKMVELINFTEYSERFDGYH